MDSWRVYQKYDGWLLVQAVCQECSEKRTYREELDASQRYACPACGSANLVISVERPRVDEAEGGGL